MSRRLWSLAPGDWPVADRDAWARALAPADSLFDDGGAAERLARASLDKGTTGYAVWMHFALRQGWLSDGSTPAARLTPERLGLWVADQRARGNENGTIATRLQDVHAVLRLMEPDADVAFIVHPGGRSLRKVLPVHPKLVDIRPSWELLGRVIALFADGVAGKGYAQGRTAIRDAAFLGLLVCPAPRIESVARMEIGTHVVRVEDGYRLHFGEQDVKTHELLYYEAMPELVPILDRYIDDTRRSWDAGRRSTKLWIGTKGCCLGKRDLTKIVLRRTEEWFGKAHGPHWFRKCLRSSASLEAPEYALDAAATLAHSPETSLRHYAKAKSLAAFRRHGERVSRLRKKYYPLAASAFGWRTKRTGTDG